DHGMWERIVLNLLSNAFKHTFEGEIVVTVRSADHEAELVVRDTGVGIPAEQVPHLFERFHRVPNARSRTHEGSGIGLALVQELVHLHGGRITVASEEGAGSTFTVRIPLGTAHLPADRVSVDRATESTRLGAAPFVEEALRWLPDQSEKANARKPASLISRTAVPPRLLVADDNADMREYVTRLLSAQGWTVDTANDGAAALAAIQKSPPNLILADIMMPGLDGFELLRAVRADANISTIPVVLLSARAGEESRIEGLEAGADDYLVKPFSARELVARVRAHLALAAARARAAAEIAAANVSLRVAHDRVRAQSRATEEALAQVQVEQARLQQLFQNAPACIGVVRGPDHIVEMANQALCRLTGARELVGRPLREVLPEAEAQGFVNLLDHVLATGTPYRATEVPIKFRRETGAPTEQSFITFAYQPMVEADGSRSGVFMHVLDVTDQVRARTELEHARAEAEAARRAAEAANQTKSEFLAAMSHELRTPLNAIAGYTELLELGVHGPITEAQRTALVRIQQSGQHLLALINDVLNFAKLEAGRVEYHIDDLPLFDVVGDVTPMLQPQLTAKGLVYSTRIPRDIMVRADRDKLQQILLNLLSNAIKFTGSGGQVTLETAAREDTPHGQVWLKVADTGIGIPREKQEAIFDPFVQVHRRLTSSTEGTGLGLSISRDPARAMGGDLFVQSEEGAGSTFTLSLPAGPN
ncbi:MAG TPA: ATP-binding protein, partial [Longimicrobiales bacterium]|nr:ATP-binding protein [Longimicrobiales bacterium]